MRNIALVDAGPLFSLFNPSDPTHHRTQSFLEEFRRKSNGRLVSTWPVVTEVSYLISSRVHQVAQLNLLRWIAEGFLNLHHLEKDQIQRMILLQDKYADVPMDLADASLLVTAEDLTIDQIITQDRDFSIYRLPNGTHFRRLPH